MIKFPWLSPYYQKITNAFLNGFEHHALLFKADEGLGGEALIEEVAGFLLCQNEQRPCGSCQHCQLFQARSHSDFYVLASIEGKDIGVDQVRELTEKLNQHAQLGGNKVVWVQGAERMTEAASNALLKTLEEPCENTYFLLQTGISSPLLPTIYSRCQVWKIRTPSTEDVLPWLKSSAPQIEKIFPALRMNAGRPLATKTFLEENLLEKRTAFLRQFWLFYSKRSPLALFPHFEKDLLFQQIDWIEAFLMDALKCQLGITSGWICQDIYRGVEKLASQLSSFALLDALKIIQQMRQDLLRINAVNQDLILLDGLTQLITEVFEPQV